MGVFEQFPYSNFHDLNLDWILNEIKRLAGLVGEMGAELVEVRGLIPEVVQTSGQSTSAVMSQKASTDAIAAAKQEAINEIPTVVQTSGQNTSAVMSQKATTDAIATAKQEAIAEIPALLGTTGQSTISGMTQKAITDAIAAIQPSGGGVKSIELYRQAGQALTPSSVVQTRYINSRAEEVNNPDALYAIFEIPAGATGVLHIESTGPDEGVQRPMVSVWERNPPDWSGMIVTYNTMPEEEYPPYSIDIVLDELPGPNPVCVTVNNFINVTPTVTLITEPGTWLFQGPLPANTVGSQQLRSDARIAGVEYVTSAPTAATVGLKFAVLTEEPATKYSGWVYLITEA